MLRGLFRESPGIEVFYESRTQTVDFKDGQIVAVKLLEGKRFSSTDAITMVFNSKSLLIVSPLTGYQQITLLLSCCFLRKAVV